MTAQSIAVALDLRVTTTAGNVHDYRTAPVDSWRAEKITGQSVEDAVQCFTGLAAFAYSCALRAGHAYRTRKASTDVAATFEAWLETIADIEMIDPDEDPQPADGKEDSSSS